MPGQKREGAARVAFLTPPLPAPPPLSLRLFHPPIRRALATLRRGLNGGNQDKCPAAAGLRRPHPGRGHHHWLIVCLWRRAAAAHAHLGQAGPGTYNGASFRCDWCSSSPYSQGDGVRREWVRGARSQGRSDWCLNTGSPSGRGETT